MALWMCPETGEQEDDGLKRRPGEEGFIAKPGWNYVGTPNWEPLLPNEEEPAQ